MNTESIEWREAIEKAIEFANSELVSRWGQDWNRKDHILVGEYYSKMIWYFQIHYTLQKIQ